MQYIKAMTLNYNQMRTASVYSGFLYCLALNQLSLLYDAAGGSTINQRNEVGDYIQRQEQAETYKIVSCQFLELNHWLI